MLVLYDDLAVDQGRAAAQRPAGFNHSAVLVSPIMAATGEGVDISSVDPEQGAEAIVLDLVNPTVALRRFGRKDRHLRSMNLGRRDEPAGMRAGIEAPGSRVEQVPTGRSFLTSHANSA
jgi:hypothetical protein